MGFRLEGGSRGAAGKLWAGSRLIDEGYDLTVEIGLAGASDIGVDMSNSYRKSIIKKYFLNEDFQYSADAVKYGYYANARLSGETSSAQFTLARYGVSGELPFMLDSRASYARRSLEHRQTTLGLFNLSGLGLNSVKWNFSAYWAQINSNLTSGPPPGYFGLTPAEPAKSDEKRYGGSLSVETDLSGIAIVGAIGEYESTDFYGEMNSAVINQLNIQKISGRLFAARNDSFGNYRISAGADVYEVYGDEKKDKYRATALAAEVVGKIPIGSRLLFDGEISASLLPPKLSDIAAAARPASANDFWTTGVRAGLLYRVARGLVAYAGIEHFYFTDSTRRISGSSLRKKSDKMEEESISLSYNTDGVRIEAGYENLKSYRSNFLAFGEFHSLFSEINIKAFSDKLSFMGEYRMPELGGTAVNLLSVGGSLRVDPALFYLRCDNLLNEAYEYAPGFPASGFSFVFGVSVAAGMF